MRGARCEVQGARCEVRGAIDMEKDVLDGEGARSIRYLQILARIFGWGFKNFCMQPDQPVSVLCFAE